MIRRPPRSTLFPYTRSSDLAPLSVRRRCDASWLVVLAGERENRDSEPCQNMPPAHVHPPGKPTPPISAWRGTQPPSERSRLRADTMLLRCWGADPHKCQPP